MAGTTPITTSPEDPHSIHHRLLEDRVLTGKVALIIGKGGQITVNINELGQYILGIAKQAAAGGAGAGTFRGEYDPAETYDAYDEVIISTGLNQGTFVCLVDGTTGVAPYTGGGIWVQKPGGLLGQWM